MKYCPDALRSLCLPVSIGLLLVSLGSSASAELLGLASEVGTGSMRVISVRSDTGAVTPGTAAATDCCLLPAGLTAVDAAGERFFAIGEWTGGPHVGDSALFRFDFDGGSIGSVAVSAVPRSLLAFDAQFDRLISLRHQPETVVLAIDPTDGSTTTIGMPATNCCEVISGVGSIDSAGQRLFVAGRDFGASGWSLLKFDLGSGSLSEVASLPPGQPGFMLFDTSSSRVLVLMQTALSASSSLVAVSPATGVIEALSAYPNADCCLYSLGDTASQSEDGQAIWTAGIASGSMDGILGHPASVGPDRPIDAKALSGDYVLHSLVVDGMTVPPGTIFWDRFEMP